MPISDPFHSHYSGLSSPVCGGFDIMPDDTADLNQLTRGLMVSTAGDVSVILKNGDPLTLTGLTPGVIYPVRLVRVLATGTTATGLKGLI